MDQVLDVPLFIRRCQEFFALATILGLPVLKLTCHQEVLSQVANRGFRSYSGSSDEEIKYCGRCKRSRDEH